MKAHSGWAALVAVGIGARGHQIAVRRRVELVAPADASWAKQPYHAAESLTASKARELIERAITAARQRALDEMRSDVRSLRAHEHEVVSCAVLLPSPLPGWSIDEIRAVHIRMHKAEGVLFPDALARAADRCTVPFVAIAEKSLSEHAEQSLGKPYPVLMKEVETLGKTIGPPWGKDQKIAALAAMIALEARCNQRS